MSIELREWNDLIIAEFRANAGVVRWSSEEDLLAERPVPGRLRGFAPGQGAPILLVTHTGATTGRRRTSPLMYQSVGDAFAIFATFGGSPRAPAWYRNIQRHPEVMVEVGTARLTATARVSVGAERDQLWARQVELVPAFADFEATAGREIPVVVLDPTGPAGDRGGQ